MTKHTDSNEEKIRESIKKGIRCHLKLAMIEAYDEMILELEEMKRKLTNENKL